MTVITIEYQMGCGGRDIARLLAGELGLSYVDREIVKDVAHELHVAEAEADQHDERLAGLLERSMSMFWTAGELIGGPLSAEHVLATVGDMAYHRATREVIAAAARRNEVVIVGHGAAFALAGWRGVMHVGLYAPLEQRIQTIMARMQVDAAEAGRRIAEREEARARYIRQFYQANVREADHYHLLLDTARFAPAQVVALIAQAWRASTIGAPHQTGA